MAGGGQKNEEGECPDFMAEQVGFDTSRAKAAGDYLLFIYPHPALSA
jgi:hypothetical protein